MGENTVSPKKNTVGAGGAAPAKPQAGKMLGRTANKMKRARFRLSLGLYLAAVLI